MGDWTWDESLFAGTAPYYEQGRLPYAPGLANALATELGLDGHGRLLDAGCGPGTIARRLARLFETVVGLDPDPDMIAEARRLAQEQNIRGQWVQDRAEHLPAGLGAFRVVMFAASFHWMDRPAVARAVRTMLEPGGAAVQIDAPAYRPDELHVATASGAVAYPAPPEEAMDALRRRYLGPDRRAGAGIRNHSPSGEDEVFRAAGFEPARVVAIADGRVLELAADRIVAGVFSTSATAPHLLGLRQAQFERDLRRLLSETSPTGLFSVRLPDNILRIWRPRERGGPAGPR